MNKQLQTLPDKQAIGEMMCVWAGFVSITLFVITWIVAVEWLFPPPPDLNATEITDVYLKNTIGIKIGTAVITNFAAPLTLVFAAIITIYMLRMKGPSPVLAYINLATSAIQVLIFIIPTEIFAATAFRLDRNQEITQFGNDLGWLIFDNVVGPTQVQWLAIALAILWDKSEQPLFPRWFAWFNIWGATVILLNNLVLFFKTGPFAWNGLLGWWPGAGIFCLWYYVAFYVMFKAVQKHHRLIANQTTHKN